MVGVGTLASNKSLKSCLCSSASTAHPGTWDLPRHQSLEVYYLLLPGDCQEGIVHECPIVGPIQVGNVLPEASGIACA